MASEREDEYVLRRDFERGSGIDLSGFLLELETAETAIESPSTPHASEHDPAFGEMTTPFTQGTEEVRGEDGVIALASEGELGLHWSLMVAMITMWSALGAVIGFLAPAWIGIPSLLGMAILGLMLGERWIPDPSMRVLGVVWVIVSMKMLYGLMIDLGHWGLLGPQPDMFVGALLIGTVVLNLVIAHHHDEDAIAAQATLILLLIGSAAGAPFGGIGVAAMIGLGTLLMHGMAFQRASGNLAALGIASSNLWVGIHALGGGWEILGLQIIGFDDPLLLLLLLTGVNGVNAVVATAFSADSNWFSDAADLMGLGRPGLWSVSVGIGMIGALLAITAHRDSTGHALAQVLTLSAAYGGSYLVVRGVPWMRIVVPLLGPMPLLLSLLILIEVGALQVNVDGYTIHAIALGCLTAWLILRDQSRVSDPVLWMGAAILCLLLTILIPTGSGSDVVSRDSSAILLGSIGLLTIGLATIAMARESPSLAGMATLMPWAWCVMFALDLDRSIAGHDLIPVALHPADLASLMVVAVLIQVPMNLRMGGSTLNLASRWSGSSEMMARARDSGMLQLWNLGFCVTCLTIVGAVVSGSMHATGVLVVLGTIMLAHVLAWVAGLHDGAPRLLHCIWIATMLIIGLRAGLRGSSSMMMAMVAIPIVVHLMREANRRVDDSNRITSHAASALTWTMGGMALLIGMEVASITATPLEGVNAIETVSLVVAPLVGVGIVLGLFLPLATRFQRVIGPSLSATALLVTLAIHASDVGDDLGLTMIVASFLITGSVLVTRTDLRKEFTAGVVPTEEQQVDGGGLQIVDARQWAGTASDAMRMRVRARQLGREDVGHRPTLLMIFLVVTLGGAIAVMLSTGRMFSSMIGFSTVALLLIGLARNRMQAQGMTVQDIGGVEMPVFLAIGGLVVLHALGTSTMEFTDMTSDLTMMVMMSVLGAYGLVGRHDLGLRIPDTLEVVIGGVVVDRCIQMAAGNRGPSLLVDLDAGSLQAWLGPWILIELLLIVSVLVWHRVDVMRRDRDMVDHRGAGGRSAWVASMALASIGPALVLAACLGFHRARAWSQPNLLVTTITMAPLGLASILRWVIPADLALPVPFLLISGVVLVAIVRCIRRGWAQWTPAWLLGLHITTLIGAAGLGHGAWIVTSLIGVSLVAWTAGVLEMRRGWRLIGFGDLLIAWVATLVSVILVPESAMLLVIMLGVTAVQLSFVTWLTQTHRAAIAIT